MPNAGDDPEDNSAWNNLHHAYMNNVPVQMPAEHLQPQIGGIYHQSDLYTMYANNMPPGIHGNFTMMPVGHGNYVQVFHQTDGPEQPVFNSYELFAPNAFVPHQAAMHQLQQQEQQQSQVPNIPDMSQPSQTFHTNNDSSTNMFINRLVTNWKPNVSGTYSPFGEQNSHLKAFNAQVMDASSSSVPSSTSLSQPSASTASLDSSQSSSLVTEKNLSNGSPSKVASTKTNGNLESSGGAAPEVRKRIVAEVKPMRMSYSDVLSKNVSINETVLNETTSGGYLSSSDSAVNSSSKGFKSVQDKSNGKTDEKKSASNDSKDKFEAKSKKYESQSSYRNDESSGSSYTNLQKEKRKSNGEEIPREPGLSAATKSAKKTTPATKGKVKLPLNGESFKRRSYKRDLDDEVFLASSSTENDKDLYYNVTKTELSFDRQPKTAQNLIYPTKKSRLIPTASQKSSFRSTEKPTYYSRRSQKSPKDTRYEFLVKMAEKWYEYTLMVLTWLFYLVYDIVVLGFGIIYDRMNNYAASMCSFFVNLRQEFRNNSGKPSAWMKNAFKKFDGKFEKNSRWAFWRRFTERKKETEPTQDFYENGRLPQTGDEAIYSLLNCKGKDAYSILGVTSESSQEQIRKHYKKIAMLVHPDKNKQPGAEEAFKVLQRAFELIGEPENRGTYDKSLAEELDAKKQWSELHDLLSQLQQKIAEAANTIRCSSCGLRHPRKLTERPHYAARECSSCKIRHSAREGDIWTETTIFGLRWRYLALMEGKVYDITEWANCQKGALAYLQPNSHVVQYRIVRGAQEKQQHEKQSKERSKREFGKLLDNIYSGHNPQAQQSTTSRRRTKRN